MKGSPHSPAQMEKAQPFWSNSTQNYTGIFAASQWTITLKCSLAFKTEAITQLLPHSISQETADPLM